MKQQNKIYKKCEHMLILKFNSYCTQSHGHPRHFSLGGEDKMNLKNI